MRKAREKERVKRAISRLHTHIRHREKNNITSNSMGYNNPAFVDDDNKTSNTKPSVEQNGKIESSNGNGNAHADAVNIERYCTFCVLTCVCGTKVKIKSLLTEF